MKYARDDSPSNHSIDPAGDRTRDASPAAGDAVPATWTRADATYPRGRSVAALFEQQVARDPDAPGLRWGDETLSYGQLNRRANQLAHALRADGVGHETPVAVFMEPSIDLIVAILAICKAGATYVPLDITYPQARLAFMLEDIGARLIVTHAATRDGLPEHAARLRCVDALRDALARQPEHNPVSEARGDSRVYVMYTSGSTGRPKGIEVLHRGISRLVIDTEHVPVGPGTRVAQGANAAFDAFTFEMWVALLNGALLVGVARDTMLDPFALAEFITAERISVLFMTPALFHFAARVCPIAFSSLDALIVGGDALAPKWSRSVLEHGAPRHLINGYGPTETTVFATFHDVRDVPEDATSVPIGRPFNGSSVYILNEAREPVAVGEVGEVYIGGEGVARGYVNRPELNAERFLPSPFRAGERLYRTGDLGRWLPSGAIDFIGRADAQVKIRGFRIELGEIEAVFRRQDAVAELAVVARKDDAGGKRLVAYIVPEDRALCAPERRDEASGMIAALRDRAGVELPDYMLPSAFALLERLPLTPNRKLDRARLPDATLFASDASQEHVEPQTDTERRVAALWSDVLGIERVSTRMDWSAGGGNSLLAALLLLRIQSELGVKVSAYVFYERPTIEQLARVVDEQRRGQVIEVAEVARVDLHREARLDPSIKPDARAPYEWCPPNQVLLTGATGFLGAWLVRDLIETTDATLYCLVRAEDASAGTRRIVDNMRKYGVWRDTYAARIVAVPGDLTQRDLGLARDEYARLAANIDTIYHSAAHVSYVEPYSWHKPVNVDGTLEIVRLAFRTRVKTLHYVSTIGIFGPNGFFEQVLDIHEDTEIYDSAAWLHLDMGYCQSKWVVEALLFQAQARGLPLNLYRPGFILGDSVTGVCNPKDFAFRIIRGCVELGQFPWMPDQRKEFVPVDYVSAAIVHISTREDQLGKRFHLIPPDPARSVSLDPFFELVRDNGYALEGCEYAEWVEVVRAFVAGRSSHALLPLMPMLDELIYKNTHSRWELYRYMPRFHSHNTRAALAGSGIEFAFMDRELVGKYLAFLCERGLIEPPRPPTKSRPRAEIEVVDMRDRVAPTTAAPDPADEPSARPPSARPTPTHSVPARLPAPTFIVELSGGRRITVPPGFNAEELRRLVTVLEGTV